MGFTPIPEVFESVYDDVEGYGRTKSASYRNWLQAKQFVFGTKSDGRPVRLAVARLQALRLGKLFIPTWWHPTRILTRESRIPPQAPTVAKLLAAQARLAELK